MKRFLYLLTGKSKDAYVNPYDVQGIVWAGEMVCHLLLDGGGRIDNVKTSAKAMSEMIEKHFAEAEAEIEKDIAKAKSERLAFLTTSDCGSKKSAVADPEPTAPDPEIGEVVLVEAPLVGEVGSTAEPCQEQTSPVEEPKPFVPVASSEPPAPITAPPEDMNETKIEPPESDTPVGMGGVEK